MKNKFKHNQVPGTPGNKNKPVIFRLYLKDKKTNKKYFNPIVTEWFKIHYLFDRTVNLN
jgi:hypothetical protein